MESTRPPEGGDPDELAALNEFLVRYHQELGVAPARPLEEWQRRFPGHEDAIARAWASLQEPAPPEARSIGGYRVIRELGRGGQGEVFLAEDPKLRRRVALKLLRAWGPGSDDAFQRFRREAEAASRLDHPGLCAVYDTGMHEGAPFIVMRYVEGDTLAQRIAAARGGRAEEEASATTVPTTPAAVSDLARIVERAARAVHAAHEAGIVHRDLKPGNIIVTAEQEPVVLDFGLARDAETARTSLTASGDLFGTPSYMSPEQISPAAGVRPDRRSDVWSLGVTLYECLTLRRPFEEATREGLYRAILTEPPADPRRWNPAVTRDLRVILDTALAKGRDHRYQTALDLAEDLRRARSFEPIRARPAGSLLKLGRWAQRNRLAAAAAALLFLSLAGGLVTSLHYLFRARADRDQRDAALRRSQRSFGRAVDAVDRLLLRAALDPGRLAFVPLLDPVRRALLQDALEFYEKLQDEHSDDPDLELRILEARRMVALIHRELGEHGRAVEEGRRLVREAEARLGKDERFALLAAQGRALVGIELRDSGRAGEARAELEAAAAAARALAAARPADPAVRALLASTLGHLGFLLFRAHDLGPAEAACREALALQDRLVEEAPDDPERRRNQAGTRQKLGGLELCRERPEEARAHYDAAAAVFREHATGREARPEDRFNLVNAQLGQAAVLRRTRQPAESERLLGEALGTAEALARDFPDRAPVQELLARTLSLLGMVRVHLGRLAEAEEALERSLAVLGAGDAAQSLDPDAAYERISAQHQLGLARSARREIGPARKALEQAIALAEDFVRSWPDQARGAQLGARALKELGGTFIDEERAAAAEPFLRRSLAVYDRLIAERRGGHGYELERAVVLGNLGVALRAAGALDEAERELGKAREALERTIAADPKEADPGPRSSLGYLLHNLALLQLDRGRGADAEKTLAAAARTQTAALRIEPGRAATRAGLRQHQQMRGQLRLKESDLAGCAALAAELARDLAADPEARYQAALLYARCAARAADDLDEAAAERFRLAALAELEEAARHGFAAPERLRQAKELQPLRELDGFRRLLRAQEAGGAQRRR